MVRLLLLVRTVALAAATLFPIAAEAKDAVSFASIEHEVGEDARLAAEEDLVSRIAGPGVVVDSARAALVKAGAFAERGAKRGHEEFIYFEPETFVTMTLTEDGSVVTTARVSRQTMGGLPIAFRIAFAQVVGEPGSVSSCRHLTQAATRTHELPNLAVAGGFRRVRARLNRAHQDLPPSTAAASDADSPWRRTSQSSSSPPAPHEKQ